MKEEKNNIILVGMPYSGKTTTAKLIAQKSGLEYLDLDNFIEEKEGIKISEIFDKKGEKYFRQLEEDSLKEILYKDNLVLSTGGGTVQNQDNLDILKQMGKVFYLEIQPDFLFERIKDDKTRPLLRKDNPKKVLSDMYEKRKENYEKADYKVDALSKPECLAEEIIKIYENSKRKNN